ncbi:MAG: hypothetical protein ACE5HY_06895, partial [Candidatus Hydrothermarchaeales archaeon]
ISPDIFKTLVARGISLLSNDKIDLISSWVVKNSYYYKIFRRMGFIHYKNIPMICYKNGLGDQIINGQYNWHFTMADSDNI